MNPLTLTERSASEAREAAHSPARALPPASEVALWCAELDEQTPETMQELQAMLSDDELARAGRFHFERDRRRYQVGRGILRSLLGGYLGQAPGEIAFSYGRYGKPSLAGCTQAGRSGSNCTSGGPSGPALSRSGHLYFNVAHSEGLALFAFSRSSEVGVDLEHIRDVPEWEQLAGNWFLPRDVMRLKGLQPELRREEFFRLWTRTEARLKASGLGLGAEDGRREDASLQVCSLGIAAGFAAAVTASRAHQWATLHQWREPGLQLHFARRSRRIHLTDTPVSGPTFL
jgi:4'-phosphopantetheinyl transferase